jgi:hypothetical protein
MRGLEDVTGVLTKFAFATTGVGMNRLPFWADQTTQGTHQEHHPTLNSSPSETTTLSDGPRYMNNDDLREITDQEERKAFWAKVSPGNPPVRETRLSVILAGRRFGVVHGFLACESGKSRAGWLFIHA